MGIYHYKKRSKRSIVTLAGDAGSSRHWSGFAKERTGRAAGDTASSVRNDTANEMILLLNYV